MYSNFIYFPWNTVLNLVYEGLSVSKYILKEVKIEISFVASK